MPPSAPVAPDYTRRLGQRTVTALGIGTALGDPTDEEDARYDLALEAALTSGVGVLDTAINYRAQRSERVVARALARHPTARPAVTVCTKGGYVPLDSPVPANRDEYRAYLTRMYVEPGIIDPADLVAGGHCLSPMFLDDQVRRSRQNLGVETIDLYYIHNPEQQLDAIPRETLDARLHMAFAAMEQCVETGAIGAYGCATWTGLRTPHGAPGHLSLESLARAAHDVAGSAHHFIAVQLPLSLAMPEAVRTPTQLVRGRMRTALDAADELGISVVIGAALMHGRLAHDLPDQVRSIFPDAASDAARALTFVRMLPQVACTVVGMRSAEHVREDAAVFTAPA